MMQEIRPGTVIGTRSATDRDGNRIIVKVIYKTETEGELEYNNGVNHATLPSSQYVQVLAKYRKDHEVARITGTEEEASPEREEESLESKIKDDGRALVREDTETAVTEKIKNSPGHNKKKIIIPAAILGLLALSAVILLIISSAVSQKRTALKESASGETSQPASGTENTIATNDGYEIAVLKNDISVGSVVSEADFEEQHISESGYDDLMSVRYITESGDTYTGTVILWDERDYAAGKIAKRNLKAGSALLKEDLTDESVSATGGMTVHLYAVITSDNAQGLTIDMGQYVLGTGDIKDILDSDGNSILEESTSGDEEP